LFPGQFKWEGNIKSRFNFDVDVNALKMGKFKGAIVGRSNECSMVVGGWK